MKLEAMIKFFHHIASRETLHGIPHAFRFKSVLSSRKKGCLRPAHYVSIDGDADADEDAAPIPKVAKPKPKRHKVNTQKGIEAQILNQAQYSFNVQDQPPGPLEPVGHSFQTFEGVNRMTEPMDEQERDVFYDRGLISLGLVRPSGPHHADRSSVGQPSLTYNFQNHVGTVTRPPFNSNFHNDNTIWPSGPHHTHRSNVGQPSLTYNFQNHVGTVTQPPFNSNFHNDNTIRPSGPHHADHSNVGQPSLTYNFQNHVGTVTQPPFNSNFHNDNTVPGFALDPALIQAGQTTPNGPSDVSATQSRRQLKTSDVLAQEEAQKLRPLQRRRR